MKLVFSSLKSIWFAVGRGNFSIVSNKSNRYGKKSQIVLEGQSLQGTMDDSKYCLIAINNVIFKTMWSSYILQH